MTIEETIKTYQVPGAIGDFNEKDFETQKNAVGWDGHNAGTYITGIGKIFLGMPQGFNRIGLFADMKLMIFKDYKQYIGFYHLPFNVPTWKYLDKYGNTIIRGLMPRINTPFICVILGDARENLDCIEIFEKDIKEMD